MASPRAGRAKLKDLFACRRRAHSAICLVQSTSANIGFAYVTMWAERRWVERAQLPSPIEPGRKTGKQQ